MAKPFVSVLIDTYNHERFIEKAVSSVLEQEFPAEEREILVVDDGSTDKTPELLRKFEPQLRVLRKENGGQASAFNAGIPECKGEIVAFLDGDDWWAAEKLACVAEAMRAEPAVGLVGHGIILVNRNGQERRDTLREGNRFRANTAGGGKLLRTRGAFLGTSRMTIRRSLLKQIGSVPEDIKIQADEYLFTVAAVLAEVEILSEALTYYRLHEANRFELSEEAGGEKVRDKQKALAALVTGLSERLERIGVAADVRDIILAYAEASAEQLRLTMDGGWPWETAKTEWALYRVQHAEANLTHQVFKLVSLLAALVTSPRTYYRLVGTLRSARIYQRARERWFPVPEMEHIRKEAQARQSGKDAT